MKLSAFSVAWFITHLSYLFVDVFLRLLSVYESTLCLSVRPGHPQVDVRQNADVLLKSHSQKDRKSARTF